MLFMNLKSPLQFRFLFSLLVNFTQLIADNDVTKEEIMDLEINFAGNTDNKGK